MISEIVKFYFNFLNDSGMNEKQKQTILTVTSLKAISRFFIKQARKNNCKEETVQYLDLNQVHGYLIMCRLLDFLIE